MNVLRLIYLVAHFFTASSAAEHVPAAAPSPSPAACPQSAAAEFIRSNCETTLYPELCYKSLKRYAGRVDRDPARLADVAMDVSLAHAMLMSAYVENLSRSGAYRVSDPRAAAALRDCISVFRDAVGQISDSIRQMRRISGSGGGGGGEELRFQMSNVQTWMSAALTNEDTCTDGFAEVADSPLKADVCNRTVKVTEVTSNALALVNSFVNKVVVP